MLRKVMLAMLGALLPLAVAVPMAFATGDCAEGYALFYKDGSWSGTPVKMCYGVNDADFTNGLGPDVNGVVHTGWHDQLSSFRVRGAAGEDQGICLYRNEQYSSRWHQSTTTEDWSIDPFNNDETDSFKWGPISPLNHRASC